MGCCRGRVAEGRQKEKGGRWSCSLETHLMVFGGYLAPLMLHHLFFCPASHSYHPPPFSPSFLIYSLDRHMAAIPALDSACHHALTLIGLICYSFPSGLGRILGTWRLDVSRQDFLLSLIYHGAKISHTDNSNLFDNRQVWGGGKLNIKYNGVFVERVQKRNGGSGVK